MKLYRVPNEWDYHGLGGFFVLAEDSPTAIRKAKAVLKREWKKNGYKWPPEPYEWEAHIIRSGVAMVEGCDD